MKATLEFNLPEDQADFDAACEAQSLRTILSDLDQWLRNQIKYGPDEIVPIPPDITMQVVRDQLREMLKEQGVPLEY